MSEADYMAECHDVDMHEYHQKQLAPNTTARYTGKRKGETMDTPTTFDQMLDRQQYLVGEMAKLRKEELELRKALVAGAFPDETEEGTHSFEMADGRVLKSVIKYNRTVDAQAVQAVNEELHKQGVDTRDLFTWKPALGVKAYKALTPDQRKIADIAVTTKPGAPDLKVV